MRQSRWSVIPTCGAPGSTSGIPSPGSPAFQRHPRRYPPPRRPRRRHRVQLPLPLVTAVTHRFRTRHRTDRIAAPACRRTARRLRRRWTGRPVPRRAAVRLVGQRAWRPWRFLARAGPVERCRRADGRGLERRWPQRSVRLRREHWRVAAGDEHARRPVHHVQGRLAARVPHLHRRLRRRWP